MEGMQNVDAAAAAIDQLDSNKITILACILNITKTTPQ